VAERRRFEVLPWSAVGAALSAASVGLVFYGANEEPFLRFRWLDAVAFFGVGPALALGFVLWEIAWLDACARVSRKSAALALSVLSLLWVGLNLLYLALCVAGYAWDLRDPRFGPLR
jgi:hypothetical protein